MDKDFEKVVCLECGMELKRITNTHLTLCCGLTMAEYRIKHDNPPIESKALAMSRVDHLRGKTYEESYGENAGTDMRVKRSEDSKKDWAENPARLVIKDASSEKKEVELLEREENPPVTGRPLDPNNYSDAICQHCGEHFEYRISDSSGKFCSRDCHIAYSRLNSTSYRIKALEYYGKECACCGATERDGVKLVVHHKDEDPLNNDMDNLEVLCNKCHSKVHRAAAVTYRGLVSPPALRRGWTQILKALKIDLTDENFRGTPARMARSYMEIFEGLLPEAQEEINDILKTTFPCTYDEMVIVKNVECWSMCPHHFLPVRYNISIGYVPKDRVIGASKLPRLAILLAKRPLLQEQFTKDICDKLIEVLDPLGAMVVVDGKHLCMGMRGIKSSSSSMVTSSVKGIFREKLAVREEFMSLIK